MKTTHTRIYRNKQRNEKIRRGVEEKKEITLYRRVEPKQQKQEVERGDEKRDITSARPTVQSVADRVRLFG